ncbi:hypothetical protein [Leisingera sp. JC11]|uniref:hypothetical protein n=1 Tax=Leisingera sp. JC11 TaxID=3042469 RepID=UPI0034562460
MVFSGIFRPLGRFWGLILLGLACLAWPTWARAELSGGLEGLTGQLDTPLEVGIGIKIDQIVNVDQKAENYSAVAVIRAEWTDPALAFDAEEFGRDVRIFQPDALADFAKSAGAVVPVFVIMNQQSNRWIHQSAAGVRSDGSVVYVEKSSLTLQAPHFNFRKYPFDTQRFQFEVASVLPSAYVNYYPLNEYSGLGGMLGEEEWILGNAHLVQTNAEGISGHESDQITLVFEGKRHITYYLIRVFLPMLVLITVSWSVFFLDEYRKRIEISGANLLVFVAFNWAISADLPKLGYLTFLDFILQWMFLATGAIIVFNVVLRKLKLAGRETLARKLDNYALKWIYPGTF